MNDYTPAQEHTMSQPGNSTEATITSTHFPESLKAIFARLAPQQVEQFAHSYQLWSLRQRIAQVQSDLASTEQQIEDNASLIDTVQPSPIALAILARLQASGVQDLRLLDRMLDRGDIWLDHTAQLLERCEKLDLIRGDYTRWCENALEGAYDWLASMSDEQATQEARESEALATTTASTGEIPGLILTSEEQLLQRLMLDEVPTEEHTETAPQATQEPAQEAVPSPVEEVTPPEPAQEEPLAPVEETATQEPATEEEAAIAQEPLPATEAVEEQTTTATQEPEQPEVEPATPQVSTPSEPQSSIEATTEPAQEQPEPEGAKEPVSESDIQHAEAQPAGEAKAEQPSVIIAPQPEAIPEESQPRADMETLPEPAPSHVTVQPAGEESEQPVDNDDDTIELHRSQKALREANNSPEQIDVAHQTTTEEDATSPSVSEQELSTSAEQEEDTQADLRKRRSTPVEEKQPLTPSTQPAQPAIPHERRPIEDEPTIPLRSWEEHMNNAGTTREEGERPVGADTPEAETKKSSEENQQEEVSGTSPKGLPILVRKVLGQIWNS